MAGEPAFADPCRSRQKEAGVTVSLIGNLQKPRNKRCCQVRNHLLRDGESPVCNYQSPYTASRFLPCCSDYRQNVRSEFNAKVCIRWQRCHCERRSNAWPAKRTLAASPSQRRGKGEAAVRRSRAHNCARPPAS